MNFFFRKNHRVVFYSVWIVLALVQSRYTELLDDEAYYWVYSRYLDWGYFDHPPMIALLIKCGYSLFQNELGVRFFPVILNTLTLFIIEKLINKKDPFLFYAIIFSLATYQLAGFFAVPDTPLIFFTALFFLCYKNFIKDFSIPQTLLLGVVTALLLYSKYHGVLIIFFVLLSNLKLFTRYQTYLAGIIALLFFAPHLWWQYQHNWVTFRYHLFESNVNDYLPRFTLKYILDQLLLAGPLAGFILVPAAFLFKRKDLVERAMFFTMAGIYIFFLLSTFRGKVEANWTAPVLVLLVVLSHQFIVGRHKYRKILYVILPVTFAIVMCVRIAMMVDLLPVSYFKKNYHSWNKWPAQMRERTKGLPVVFNNSYQRASKYWFYSGQMTYSLNFYRERRNNYNFWPIEDSLLGKPVYNLDIYYHYKFPNSVKTAIGDVGWRFDPSFASFAKIQVSCEKSISIENGQPLRLHCRALVPEHYNEFITSHPGIGFKLLIGIFNHQGWVEDLDPGISMKQLINPAGFDISVPSQVPKGEYYLRLAIGINDNLPTHNSEKIKLSVK